MTVAVVTKKSKQLCKLICAKQGLEMALKPVRKDSGMDKQANFQVSLLSGFGEIRR